MAACFTEEARNPLNLYFRGKRKQPDQYPTFSYGGVELMTLMHGGETETAFFAELGDMAEHQQPYSLFTAEAVKTTSLDDVFGYLFNQYLLAGIHFRTCKYCGKFFGVGNRSKVDYCNRRIEGSIKTCKETGAIRLYEQRTMENPAIREYKEGYRYTARKLKEHFEKRKLVDIRPLDVENYIHEMQQNGLSDSYIAKLRGMLFQIMNKAAANDLIRKNPVQYAEKSKSVNPPKEKEAFTAEEVRLLMKNLPENRLGWSIRLMLGTGMRGQELLALQKEHIEEDGAVIHIRQAVKLVKGKTTIGQPKSKSSTRDIPVPAGLRKYAIALRNAGGDFVWEGAIPGQPYDARHLRDHFKSALKAIPGVRVLTPHSCRHTYVTQMQALGVDLQTIQSIAGHADLDMTEHYLHVQQSVKEAAVSKFDAAFFPRSAVQAVN